MITREIATTMELRAIAFTVRWAILHVAMLEPDKEWYAWELAEAAGIKQTNVYHHLKILVEYNFLIATLDRVVNGIEEKTYRAAQHRIEFHLGRDRVIESKASDRGRNGSSSSTEKSPRCSSDASYMSSM